MKPFKRMRVAKMRGQQLSATIDFNNILFGYDVTNKNSIKNRNQTIRVNKKIRDIMSNCEATTRPNELEENNWVTPFEKKQKDMVDRLFPSILEAKKVPIGTFLERNSNGGLSQSPKAPRVMARTELRKFSMPTTEARAT